jgi:hypothetical protein
MLCHVMMNPLTYYTKIPAFGPLTSWKFKTGIKTQIFHGVLQGCYTLHTVSHWHSDGQYSLHLQDEVDVDLPVTIYHSTSRNIRDDYNFNQHSRENLKFRTHIPTSNYLLTTGKHRQRTPSKKQLRSDNNLRCTVKINIT